NARKLPLFGAEPHIRLDFRPHAVEKGAAGDLAREHIVLQGTAEGEGGLSQFLVEKPATRYGRLDAEREIARAALRTPCRRQPSARAFGEVGKVGNGGLKVEIGRFGCECPVSGERGAPAFDPEAVGQEPVDRSSEAPGDPCCTNKQ